METNLNRQMAVLKWSRLEEEVDVANLPEAGNSSRKGAAGIFAKKLGASLGLLGLLLFLVITRTEQQGLNQFFELTLNSTIEKAGSLRAELQEIGARVNSANGKVEDLRTSLHRLSTAKPWIQGLDRIQDQLEKEIGSAGKERSEALGNISLAMGAIRKQEMYTKNLTAILEQKGNEIDHLKTGMRVLSNSSQSLASLVHSRLDIVEKSNQNLSISQSGLEGNVFRRIAALQYR